MAPSFLHGRNVHILLNQKDVSQFFKQMSLSAGKDMHDITTFNSSGWKYSLSGLNDAKISMDGLFSCSTVSADDVNNYLDSAFGTTSKSVVTIDMNHSTGGRAMLFKTDWSAYDITTPVSDIVSIKAELMSDSGYQGGVMLRPLSIATSTGSNSGVITPGTTTAGGSTTGGTGHFHLTAQSTLTSATVKIQHSTSGSTWADLITFTAATAETSQRSTVAGTVKERVRSTISALTGGSSKSITAAVSFTRRSLT